MASKRRGTTPRWLAAWLASGDGGAGARHAPAWRQRGGTSPAFAAATASAAASENVFAVAWRGMAAKLAA